jgi:hypothetical protein
MSAAEDLNISGKDWLTEVEAAHYCGVSLRQFQAHQRELGLNPRRFLGRKLYLKSDLFNTIEKSDPWQQLPSNGEVRQPIYRGLTEESVVANLLERSRKTSPRK